jgi:hypothetical protein
MMAADLHISAHARCSLHRAEILRSESCACFYCFASFPPAEIQEWVDEGETALCPRCGIDSVLGSASGLPLDENLLRSMHEHWFSAPP